MSGRMRASFSIAIGSVCLLVAIHDQDWLIKVLGWGLALANFSCAALHLRKARQ